MKRPDFITFCGVDVAYDQEYPLSIRAAVVEAVADVDSGTCMLITSGQNRLWVKGTMADIVAQLERAL